jgi:hypothetical protein
MYHLHHHSEQNHRAMNSVSSNWQIKHAPKIHYLVLASVFSSGIQLLVNTDAVPTLLILFTLLMEAMILRNVGSYKGHRRQSQKAAFFIVIAVETLNLP